MYPIPIGGPLSAHRKRNIQEIDAEQTDQTNVSLYNLNVLLNIGELEHACFWDADGNRK